MPELGDQKVDHGTLWEWDGSTWVLPTDGDRRMSGGTIWERKNGRWAIAQGPDVGLGGGGGGGGGGLPALIAETPRTGFPFPYLAAQQANLISRPYFIRANGSGKVGKIGAECTQAPTSASTVTMGVYRNTGAGYGAKPGALVASGTATVSAVGYFEVSLDSEVDFQDGDWFAVMQTVNFYWRSMYGGSPTISGPGVWGGFWYYSSGTSEALPATAPTLQRIVFVPYLLGIPASMTLV